MAREVLRAAGVLGLGPCRAGRFAGTVMVRNGYAKHDKLCVGAKHVKNRQMRDVDRHLVRCSPFFVLHDDEATPSRPWLRLDYQRGFLG